MAKKDSFKEGVSWNMASLVVLALSGVVLNVLIGVVYDAATLGAFNQVLALYTFFSMFAVGGINLSALKYIAENLKERETVADLVLSSTLLTVICTAVITIIFYSLRIPISNGLDSPAVAVGMTWITPGLFFFGVNKTLMSIVNGMHRMKAFAVFQGLRYLNLITGFCLALLLNFPGAQLAYVFSFSEGILFCILVVFLRKFWKLPSSAQWFSWVPIHFKYGVKSILSGALLELNAKVDVLMLGYFLSDRQTGIYSFAAFVYEGFMQFLVVLQNNYNPHLSRLIGGSKIHVLNVLFQRGRRFTYRYAFMLAPIVMLLYPVGLAIVFYDQPEFMDSAIPFALLMFGLMISSGYVPFHNILAMGNRPGWHTLFMVITVCLNITFNALLIPAYGLNGAAGATALSLFLSCFTLYLLTKRSLQISLS